MKPLFYYVVCLAEPPDLLIKEKTNEVDCPPEGNSYKKKYDCNNESNGVVSIKALDDTVNPPNDVECGDAEDELQDIGKLVKSFDDVFHYKNASKIYFSICYILIIQQKNDKINIFFAFFKALVNFRCLSGIF